MNIVEIVHEALAEDAREGRHFDAEGFSNFCPEESTETVREAWLLYDRIVYGGEKAEDLLTFGRTGLGDEMTVGGM